MRLKTTKEEIYSEFRTIKHSLARQDVRIQVIEGSVPKLITSMPQDDAAQLIDVQVLKSLLIRPHLVFGLTERDSEYQEAELVLQEITHNSILYNSSVQAQTDYYYNSVSDVLARINQREEAAIEEEEAVLSEEADLRKHANDVNAKTKSVNKPLKTKSGSFTNILKISQDEYTQLWDEVQDAYTEAKLYELFWQICDERDAQTEAEYKQAIEDWGTVDMYLDEVRTMKLTDEQELSKYKIMSPDKIDWAKLATIRPEGMSIQGEHALANLDDSFAELKTASQNIGESTTSYQRQAFKDAGLVAVLQNLGIDTRI